jgi:hypothetical protein
MNISQKLEGPSPQGLLGAVPQLSQLTSLTFKMVYSIGEPPPAAASFRGLTASTNLRHLRSGIWSAPPYPNWELFQEGTAYPSLLLIDLSACFQAMAVSDQQLQQLCAWCPAVESLRLAACCNPSPTAWQPLTQLSALTHLVVGDVGEAVGAVTDAASQLAGLRHLELSGIDAPGISLG